MTESPFFSSIQKTIDSFRSENFTVYIQPSIGSDYRLSVSHGNGKFTGVTLNLAELRKVRDEINEFLNS